MTTPRPREARLLNCVLISLYGTSFLFFLKTWMNITGALFLIKFVITYVLCLTIHFLILYKRQQVYEVLCQLTQKRIRFFEFPYFVLVSILYLFIFLVWPFLIGLIMLPEGVSGIFEDQDLTMFILFGGGAGLVAAAVSGFDIYPVNVFRTKASLQHLITITRDLMKFSNRLLALVSGAVVVGWAFKKVEFSLSIVYMTAYGIIGFALGSTAALGSRVTGLLYALSRLEDGQEVEQAPEVQNNSED